MKKTKYEAALRRKAGCKRLTKKGLFHCNQLEGKNRQIQLSENSSPITDSPAPFSTLAKKILREIKSINTLAQSSKEEDTSFDSSSKELVQSCFILFQTDMLSSIIDLLAIFPYCRNNSINNNFNLADRKRSVPLELYCSIETYEWTKTIQASKKNYNNTKGMKPFELNYRSDLAMGQI